MTMFIQIRNFAQPVRIKGELVIKVNMEDRKDEKECTNNVMTKKDLNEMYKILFIEYPEIVCVSEMQKMLGISRHAAYDLVKSSAIPALKIGTSFRILKINIISYMLDSTVST